jgi:hypothetical protein
VRVTKRDNVHVPWLELARTPSKYLDITTLPEGFQVLDPSKMTKRMISQLWFHWSKRADAEQPILIFLEGRDQDLGSSARWTRNRPSANRKRLAYVVVDSDDELDGPSGKSQDGAHTGEGSPESLDRLPLSKRPRLSEAPAIPDEQSPATNNDDRKKFLSSLSQDPFYKTLLDGVLALPISVSPFSICMDLSNYSYI